MFSAEFFPTPAHVIEMMGIDCYGKVVLEPSAGKGDIVEWLKANGAKDVLVCEANADLRRILSGKCRLVTENFFDVKAEDISHVQQIVMNPPFSNAEKHILHAFEIAPEGCEIIALCNMETLNKSRFSEARQHLDRIIKDYGEALPLGQCFNTAERKTDVEVGLVRLFKPAVSAGFDFDGFYLEMDEEKEGDGIMPYNDVRAIVNSYVAAVACFDKVEALGKELRQHVDFVGFNNYGTGLGFNVSHGATITTKTDFAKALQAASWRHIFAKMKLEKFVTSGVMSDLNKFIQSRSNYPFTMRNIYRMFEIIVGTREHTMNRAICEAVDKITEHTHENRFAVEGWKTNAGHMLNQKFILNWMVESDYRGEMRMRYNSNTDRVADLEKALCYITGRNYEDMTNFRSHFNNMGSQITSNTWYSCSFFEYKCFKKGTMHFKFQREEDWQALNRAYARIKGMILPETVWQKQSKSHTAQTA